MSGRDWPEISPDPADTAIAAACALLESLVEKGVRHVVVSPGSRSQALALAAAELERQGWITLHVRIDERVAGFTAVGIGRETGMPAAVICTSGTAVANLMPAVLEAHHGAVPLLLLTADRPPELRGVGANQATRQTEFFGDFVRFFAEPPAPGDPGSIRDRQRMPFLADHAVATAIGPAPAFDVPWHDWLVANHDWLRDIDPSRRPGPVHLNLPYREPLAGPLPEWFRALREPRSVRRVDPPIPHVVERGPRTVVVAGEGAGPAAEELAHRGGWPLIAEIVSGSRFGRHVVHGYRAALDDPELGGRIERALVLGHPTLSRQVTRLLSRPDLEVIAARGAGEDLNLNGRTDNVDAIDVADGEIDREWLGAWMRFSRAHLVDLEPAAPDLEGLRSTEPKRRLAAVRAELDAVRTPLDRAQLVAGVWAATWPHDRLMFGSSRLVRVADEVLGGKKVRVHANRGLAGIDGTIATGLGIALASQADGAEGVTRVLLGDLAFLHDVGALLLPEGETPPRIQVIVGNDGGGTIFDGLEVAAVASPDAMTRVQYTPQRADLAAIASAYGWEHVRATTRAELDQALLAPVTTPRIIEVPLER